MITQASSDLELSAELMARFAEATGLEGPAPPRRYLWTDAFAVCNYLGLHRALGDARYLDLALNLVDQVHHVLGRHRPDDSRQGWISGLSEEAGERHPTRGGLRIGKPLPERQPGEIFDPRLEWERDGQYFHYLTQWMHALERVSEETGRALFHRWAVELAATAHAAFTAGPPTEESGGRRRLAWKMSIALDRPLVSSMGQHDPLDAWLAYLELEQSPLPAAEEERPRSLGSEIAEAREICRHVSWVTDDALGAGSLLVAAHKLARLELRGGVEDEGMLEQVVEVAAVSTAAVAASKFQEASAEHRLAFRELGLAIGLHAAGRMREAIRSRPGFPADGMLSTIGYHLAMGAAIERFWSKPIHRDNATWREHEDINAVMLATSVAPEGYLGPH
ncbi:MAG TPA: hypothetical protein VKA53_09075 [Thermoanaerobaculia bacterium]|nr:hypothetical protein [Thermoanaerobaculia bacterium]